LARSSVSCARENLRHVRRIAWRSDPTHGHRDADRPGFGEDHIVADAGHQPFGGSLHIFERAIVEDDAELVTGKAAELVAAAHLGAQPFSDGVDRFVGDVKTIGLVDACEIVDRHQHESARCAPRHSLPKRRFQRFCEGSAIHLSGQVVEV
jgi:hypothetical protein